jgi:pyruvate dehydrogenase E1 component alpha subunit
MGAIGKTNKKMTIPKDILLSMYRKMVEIRQFEDMVYLMFLQGTIPGTVHLYQGQEAVAVGVCANLKKDDVILSTHRADGHALAKGVPVRSCLAELLGKVTGCCGGKGGVMHLGDMSVGMVPAIAIVAGGMPIATGCALAFKFQKKDNVAVAFFGDGATNEGVWHEAVNMGAIWNLPVIYVCENNLYGASTHVTKVMKVKDIAERAPAYGIPGVVVDGNDVIGVYEATLEAVARARSGGGPTLLECKTYRRVGHSRGDANLYRDKEEEKLWLARDPILIAQNRLKEMGVLTDKLIQGIDEEVKIEIQEAVTLAQSDPYPAPEDCLKGLWVE